MNQLTRPNPAPADAELKIQPDPYNSLLKSAMGRYALTQRPVQVPARTTGIGFWRRSTAMAQPQQLLPQQMLSSKEILGHIERRTAMQDQPEPTAGITAWWGPGVVQP